MKRLAGYTAVVMATLATLIVLWYFRGVVLLFLFSLIAAAAVRPVITRLRERGLSLVAAMIIVYITSLGFVGLLLYLLGDALLDDVQSLANDLASGYEMLRPDWLAGNAFQQFIANRLPPLPQLYDALGNQEGILLARSLFGATRSLMVVLGGTAVVLVLSIYWSVSQTHFERLWLSLLPAARRTRARSIWRAMETGVGAYVRSEAVQAFVAALLLGIGYWAMGVTTPVLLALGGAIAWLIPLIGFVFITIPAFLVGLSTSLSIGIAAAFYTLAVLLFLELQVEPRIFNRRRYNSVLTVFTMLALVNALGIIGLIVAPPLAAAIQIFSTHLMAPHRTTISADSAAQIAELEERLAALQATFTQDTDRESAPEIASIIERLSRLVQKANEALPPDSQSKLPTPTSQQ
jgi:predicted PurR-regulated permease PerM